MEHEQIKKRIHYYDSIQYVEPLYESVSILVVWILLGDIDIYTYILVLVFMLPNICWYYFFLLFAFSL